VQLKVEDIEAILDTLIYDGKVEKTLSVANDEETRFYRAVEGLLQTTGLMRVPCGGCPVIKDCSDKAGAVNPVKCKYITEWLC
jgi:DNA-directed RNA polymerase III subunit RPC6